MSDPTADRLAIRDLVENWAVWRDAGDWERFRTVWHPDSRMMATWFQGPGGERWPVPASQFERSHVACPGQPEAAGEEGPGPGPRTSPARPH